MIRDAPVSFRRQRNIAGREHACQECTPVSRRFLPGPGIVTVFAALALAGTGTLLLKAGKK